MNVENVQTVVIGGGQAGLAASHELSARGLPHVVLEGGARVGDSWRHRWDSLRLFTPARYDGLPGRPFPGDPWSLPTKDQLADYLESYAADLAVPVRTGVRVRGVTRSGDGFLVEADEGAWHAQNVVVATGFDRVPRVPAFAADVRPDVVQLDAGSYRAPDQAGPGDVLVVGAGNSGADIALELAATHRTFLSGRHPGQIPWRIEQPLARPLNRLAFWAFRHVLTTGTPIGRRARADVLAHSGPLIRVKSRISPPRASSACPGPPASGTDCRCSTTAARWTSRPSCGAPASTPTTAGSTCPCATTGRPDARPGGHLGAGAVLPRAGVPVRPGVVDDQRCRRGRGLRRRPPGGPRRERDDGGGVGVAASVRV